MKHRARTLLLCLAPLAGCHSDPTTPVAAPVPSSLPLPPSALAGAVRALELVERHRPRDPVQIRAVESDALRDPATGAERVRVLIDLTLYSTSADAARAAFEELRAALAAVAPEDLAPPGNERAVLAMLREWTPRGSEDLVSFSDIVRVEVPRAVAGPAAAPASGTHSTASVATYIRSAAGTGLGQVDIALRRADPAAGETDLIFRVSDVPTEPRDRGAIGAFLAALEEESPAARVTRLRIEHSQNASDIHAERAWTFSAELTLRGHRSE